MKPIGFLTSEEKPRLADDDRLVLKPLASFGLEVRPVIWTQPFEPTDYCGLIFRSVWDYHRRLPEFLKFCRSLASQATPVVNSPKIVAWNSNKKYLFDLSRKGVLIPTSHCIRSEDEALKILSDFSQTSDWVIKPTVSLNGFETYRISGEDEKQARALVARLLKGSGEILLQEFMPEIVLQGEISLVYLLQKFSHAVRKVPARGEFRVQEDYGGRNSFYEPPAFVLAAAENILSQVEEPLLYARVDGVIRNDAFYLMELELIEPSLYLTIDPTSPTRFAQALVTWIQNANSSHL